MACYTSFTKGSLARSLWSLELSEIAEKNNLRDFLRGKITQNSQPLRGICQLRNANVALEYKTLASVNISRDSGMAV
jgi:hypothetical protein